MSIAKTRRMSAKTLASELRLLIPGIKLFDDVPWSRLTTLGVGGACPVVAEPCDDIQLSKLLKFCSGSGIRTLALGAGSNILGSDTASDCIAIRLAGEYFTHAKLSRRHANAGAGIRLLDLLRLCAEKGLGGMAALSGIPGTLGGAIMMNAGAHGCEIGRFVQSICGYTPDGKIWNASGKDMLRWEYRKPPVPPGIIVVGVICKFDKVVPSDEIGRIRSELLWRARNTPHGRSAGCVFRNPSSDLPAGKLIDTAGCKKMRSGGAAVSGRHANWIINTGAATEKDVVGLMVKVRRQVFKASGVYLHPELKFANPASEAAVAGSLVPLRIAVLKGGTSSEREISLKSGRFVAEGLRCAGYQVSEIDVRSPRITSEMKRCDMVFPILHGGFGEDGTIQRNLEKHRIPFLGCSSRASALCMDKIESKKIMIRKGILTPGYAMLASKHRNFPENLRLPVIVKPVAEGSTVGITLVTSMSQWEKALDKVFALKSPALVETYVKGHEITVGIVGGKALPVIEIRFPGAMYDYDAKYVHKKGDTQYLCPPPPDAVSPARQRIAQRIALEYYKAIGARDLLRVDMILDDSDKKFYVLEGNNLPGFTESSLVPKAAKQDGIAFPELCAKLAALVRDRAGL